MGGHRKSKPVSCPSCTLGNIILQKEIHDAGTFAFLTKKQKIILGNKETDGYSPDIFYSVACDNCEFCKEVEDIKEAYSLVENLIKAGGDISCCVLPKKKRPDTERKRSPLCIIERSEIEIDETAASD